MSQQLGASRMVTQFGIPDNTDEKLANMLNLYRAPATIRDMKQVFFYTTIEANTTRINPITMRYNVTDVNLLQNQFYYAPVGTTRQFNIADKVNDLIDIRIPKDKYVIEINLVECVIEADPSNWLKIPDRVARIDGANLFVEDTFNWTDSLAPPDGSVPQRQTINTWLTQATKLSEPQTLYCRIKELANGEPFNWSITNSGAFSVDKSHQLLVRHGDINYARLTLEFGHLVFLGRDQDYEDLINDPNQNVNFYSATNFNAGVPRLRDLKERYGDYLYVDYNTETFNNVVKEAGGPFLDADYPQFYKGIGGVNFQVADQVLVPGASNMVQPANRPPFAHVVADPPGVVDPYNLQGKPLLFNQQVSRIGFRFLVRIIHTY